MLTRVFACALQVETYAVANCLNSGSCSIAAGVQATLSLTDSHVAPHGFATVLIHPQDFNDGDVATINAFFDSLLADAVSLYDLRLIRDMATP